MRDQRWVLLLIVLLGAGCGGKAAGKASPGVVRTSESLRPRDHGLVDLRRIEPSILLDIRYATTNNFTGKVVYPVAACRLKKDVAEALARVQKKLKSQRMGLKVFDCYRPLSVQKKFWEIMPDPRYVADPKKGSRHNRGYAVDLTLLQMGREVDMPTDYDDFTEKAHRSYHAPKSQARYRFILEEAMVKEGFVGLRTEWWHFDYPGWQDSPVLDIPLEDIR